MIYLEGSEEQCRCIEELRARETARAPASLPPDSSFRWLSSSLAVWWWRCHRWWWWWWHWRRRWMMLAALLLKAYRHPARIRSPEIAAELLPALWTSLDAYLAIVYVVTIGSRCTLPVPDADTRSPVVHLLGTDSRILLFASKRTSRVIIKLRVRVPVEWTPGRGRMNEKR